MIDIHSHIIPFVDDGSSSLEESLIMVKHAIANNVDTIIATPHHIYKRYVSNIEEITKNFNDLKKIVEDEKLPIKLLLGQEIFYTSRDNIIEKLNNKELLTLNNTKYVLLEFSFLHIPEDIIEIIYNFNINGYKVIIAHVERYEWIDLDLVRSLKAEGALIQINSNSILGLAGRKLKKLCKKLLKNNLVDFVASDTHSFRPSTLLQAKKVVKNDSLFTNNLFETKESELVNN